MDHLLRATRNTWKGIIACANTELAFRQELVVLAIALPLACVIATSLWRLVVLISVLLLVLVVELLNTAIEKLADRITRQSDPAIGRIKDMGSAAVGLSIVIATLVWLAAIAERAGLL